MKTIWSSKQKDAATYAWWKTACRREGKEKGGATKTIYYAKAGRSETAAKLDLELVLTTPNGLLLHAIDV